MVRILLGLRTLSILVALLGAAGQTGLAESPRQPRRPQGAPARPAQAIDQVFQSTHDLGRPAAPVAPEASPAQGATWRIGAQAEDLVSPQGLSSTINLLLMATVLSLAPSILMMTTCFVRFVIVFGLLRQALGTQQLPPNQILMSLSLFLTFMIMSPVWQQSYEQGIRPYTSPVPGEAAPTLDEMFQKTALPVRRFMSEQIDRAGNNESIWTFIDYLRPNADSPQAASYHDPQNEDEIPLVALLPAYMLSELKVAFCIGFQLFLPFIVIDMVVAAVLTSMGMMMLPPSLVSLPFKLLLFVLIDGWGLTVGMMLNSVRPGG